MEQRISLITLGVQNLVVSRTFYEEMGFNASGLSSKDVVFFQMKGVAVGLFQMDVLLAEQKLLGTKPVAGGITIAYNTRSKEEVDSILEQAVTAGGTLLASAKETPWGSYTGYFADPDGHSWEITWFEAFSPAEDGSVIFDD